ncbi:MAG: PAS domain-containing protein [Proteobacteria bacterium]|nr:PAS domain-containing protein [Pseudomonadota bacterium]
MSRPARLAITALSLALAAILAGASPGPQGADFFYPALMLAGLFGGPVLALVALAFSIALAQRLYGPDFALWTFAAAALLLTVLAMVLRLLFQESRRWGVRYRKLLSAMSSAVTVSDGEGRIERPHPELSRLIGMDWPDYAGRRWFKSVHPDDHHHFQPKGEVGRALQRAEIRLKDPQTGEWRWHLMRAVALVDESGKVDEWISVLTDIHDRKLAGEQREVMIGEARHRLKNLITIIESIAKSSRPREADGAVDAFLGRFLGRLHALSAAGDLALAGNYSSMPASELVRATLAPFLEKDSARIVIEGPVFHVREVTGGALALGLNELATNSIKYGSLSVPGGRVKLSWQVVPEAEGDRVTLEWRESGGPPPSPPQKEGYGTRVIRVVASREANGKVEMGYPPEGYFCRITYLAPPRRETEDTD